MENEIIDAKKSEERLIEARKKRVQSFIENATEVSATTISNLVQSEDVPPVVRLAAAKDLLDRGGFKPVDKVAVAVLQPITGMKFVLDDTPNGDPI